jgi:hypothetical protein
VPYPPTGRLSRYGAPNGCTKIDFRTRPTELGDENVRVLEEPAWFDFTSQTTVA